MHTLAVISFLFVLAVVVAMVEIEAEGMHGWAEKFPTWYRTRSRLAKLYKFFTSKPLTGYHAALFLATLGIFIWPMVATATFSLSGLFGALAGYFAWVIVWDFAWFALNPFYTFRNFRKSNIWWFASEPWICNRVPLGYIVAWVASAAIAAISGLLADDMHILTDHLVALGLYLYFTFLLVVYVAPLYGRYYRAMRKRDDREDAGIFH